VYPSYLLGVSAGVLLVTSLHLISTGLMTGVSSWFVTIVQTVKLFHLVGYPSHVIFAIVIVIFSFTLPFVLHYNSAGASTSDQRDSLEVAASSIGIYLTLAGIGTYYGSTQIAPFVLSMSLSKSVSIYQSGCISLSVWLVFAAAVVSVCRRQLEFLRTFLLLLSGFCLLLSTESLGPLRFSLDPASSMYVVVSIHPEFAQGDQSGLFMLLAAGLVVSGFLGMFPIHRPIPRLLFAVSFSYCVAHIVLGIAFPASMGTDSPHFGMLELPWVYSLTFSSLTTTITLRTMFLITSMKKPKATGSISKNYVFLAWTSIPLCALIWAFLEDSLRQHALGIMWVAVVQFGLAAVVVRVKSVVSTFSPSVAATNTSEIPLDIASQVIVCLSVCLELD
jgi:hypothetical protein